MSILVYNLVTSLTELRELVYYNCSLKFKNGVKRLWNQLTNQQKKSLNRQKISGLSGGRKNNIEIPFHANHNISLYPACGYWASIFNNNSA